MTPPVVGILGTGRHGSALARLAVSAGLGVVPANSRGPQSLAELVAELGPMARTTTATGTAAIAEIAATTRLIIAAVPLHVLRDLPPDALAGCTVVDATNYYPGWNGPIPELDAGGVTSSRLVQRHLAGATVVKAFNTIDSRRLRSLARPPGDPLRSALPVAGDREPAVDCIVALLDRLGFDAVVVGGLDESGCAEPGTPAHGAPYRGPEPPGADRAAWFAGTPGVPVPAAALRLLLADRTPPARAVRPGTAATGERWRPDS